MKLKIYHLLILLVLIVAYSACKKDDNDDDNDIPVYTNGDNVINPPAEFEVLFALRDIGNYQVAIIFDTNAVWNIERYSAATAMLWMQRELEDSTLRIDILNSINLGLEGNQIYTINGSNSVPAVDLNLFIRFTKTPHDYDSYPQKF